ncbi:NADPH HC-toxin reductase 1-like isoform X2 [Typha angustifolia]|uniref:NADPH HC-toxin reductase 1-like isoform X2 n=1 Tax=Typha angustifolia TaxID=59011 RepID=UPI003C30AAA7
MWSTVAGDKSKIDHLKSLPGANARLSLFEADIYDPGTFETAIQECGFVFLVATPFQHNPQSSKYKDTTEALVDSIRTILRLCEESGTVERVIYTGSVAAASPLREDCTGFKDFIDESCWTPHNISYAHSEDNERDYTSSKTLAEKEILSYNDDEEKRKFEVVSLTCGLVGGGTILPFVPSSVQVIVSPLTGTEVYYRQLKFLQALLGSVPLVHIEDVIEAHVFCMEKDSMAGRFLCASAYPTMQEMSEYLVKTFPENVVIEEVVGEGVGVQSSTQKLVDLGFKYRYGVEEIIDESVECSKRLGGLQLAG